jgi:hypothetical protein
MTLTTKALRGFTPARDPEAIMSRQNIILMLDEHKVPWRRSWGHPPVRSFEDFCGYHEKCRFYFRNGTYRGSNGDSKNGNGNGNSNGNGNGHLTKLTIDVHSLVALVYYYDRRRRKWWELYEEKQVFDDGTPLVRGNFNGIAETMERGMTEREEAMRLLGEETPFKDPSKYKLSDCLGVEHWDPIVSEKWPPDILAAYHRHMLECEIPRSLYRPEGYVEREGDRQIYFKWRPRRQLELKI